jgi:hypothetical protein
MAKQHYLNFTGLVQFLHCEGSALSDLRGGAAGLWPCPPGAAAGWPRCAAAPWPSPGLGA